LKNERVNRTQYPTREHARKDITRYIELRYNQIRLHSGIDYHTERSRVRVVPAESGSLR
ncbi:IS3 family transposase, partial [Nocardia sp. CT2-14]|nr:IS3 family transposase [Nocardia aurantiaca]